ncbi:MarR family transcriptional regulator [Aeromicrobium alkaliterrae]|uniref:MarR family transcriptional regulator n=1 Tax=Aeromicrobium alkaliterrae TaxID=302168 RepID=A0ABP4VFA8_9ACTN
MTSPADPDLERLQESIAWLIRLGEFHRFHRGEAGGAESDGLVLDRTGFLLLSRLEDGEPLTMGEIAEALDLSPSTTTRRVVPLAEAGLVARERHPESHRTVVVTITDAGRERVRAVRQARVVSLRETFRDWQPDALGTLAEMMERLADTLSIELVGETFADRHLRGI